MRRYHLQAINSATGLPIASASVDVYHVGTTTHATIYSDEGITVKANPFTTDTLGRGDFYVADGDYDVKISGSGITPYTISDVSIVESVQGGFVLDADHVNALLSNALYNRGTSQWNRISTSKPAWRTEADSLAANDFWAIYHAVAAANPITWTEFLRLSSAGHLGIGVIPTTRLHVRGNTALFEPGADGNTAYSFQKQGASAVAEWQALEAGGSVLMDWRVNGGDADFDVRWIRGTGANGILQIMNRGTGSISLMPRILEALRVSGVALGVNFIEITNATTGGLPNLLFTGTDANVSAAYLIKGVGSHFFYTRSATPQVGFEVGDGGASLVNWITAQGAATTVAPEFFTRGSDTNVALRLRTKGTGSIIFTPNSVDRWLIDGGGTLRPNADNAVDFGASGQRPRDIYTSRDLLLGSAGVARMLSQNRFRMLQSMVRATKTGTQSLTNGTEAIITFDAEDYDTDAMHSTVSNTGRLVAPIAGKYHVSGVLNILNVNNDISIRVRVRKNGATFVYDLLSTVGITAVVGGLAVSLTLDMAATDYVEMMGTINDAGNGTVQTTTHFEMEYVGE